MLFFLFFYQILVILRVCNFIFSFQLLMKTQSLKALATELIMKLPLTWTHVAGIWGVVLLLLLVPQSYALEVKNQLSHAVQTIKQVVFTADGMPSAKQISVTASPQGVLEINGGNIFAQADASKGSSMTNTTGSLLLYGMQNKIQGGEANIIYYGQNNYIV